MASQVPRPFTIAELVELTGIEGCKVEAGINRMVQTKRVLIDDDGEYKHVDSEYAERILLEIRRRDGITRREILKKLSPMNHRHVYAMLNRLTRLGYVRESAGYSYHLTF